MSARNHHRPSVQRNLHHLLGVGAGAGLLLPLALAGVAAAECYFKGPHAVCCSAPALMCRSGDFVWDCLGSSTATFNVYTVRVAPPGVTGLDDFDSDPLETTCTITPVTCGTPPNGCVSGTPYVQTCVNTFLSGGICEGSYNEQ